jgi:hypothetical protein
LRHSVIEWVCERDYLSRELTNAVLYLSVPIYWEGPNIGDFFDTAGMILRETQDDIQTAIKTASPKYNKMRLTASKKCPNAGRGLLRIRKTSGENTSGRDFILACDG